MDLKAEIQEILESYQCKMGTPTDYAEGIYHGDYGKIAVELEKLFALYKPIPQITKPSTDKGQYFMCIEGDPGEYEFIIGKEYMCVNDDFQQRCSFVNEQGETSGWGGENHNYFKRVEK